MMVGGRCAGSSVGCFGLRGALRWDEALVPRNLARYVFLCN